MPASPPAVWAADGKLRVRRRKNFPDRFARADILLPAIQLRQHVGADQRLRIRRKMRRDRDAHRVRRVLDKRRRVAGGNGLLQFSLFTAQRAAGLAAADNFRMRLQKPAAAVPLPKREKSGHRHQLHAHKPAAQLQRFQARPPFCPAPAPARSISTARRISRVVERRQLHGQSLAHHRYRQRRNGQVHIFPRADQNN